MTEQEKNQQIIETLVSLIVKKSAAGEDVTSLLQALKEFQTKS